MSEPILKPKAAFHRCIEELTLNHMAQLKSALAPWREELLNHRLYREIDQLASLHLFMEHHVYAVWDFMSLLKALQKMMCCTTIPWLPPVNSHHCRLVNEIVLAEESDENVGGGYASHFDLYLSSMKQCEADTSVIEELINQLRRGVTIDAAMSDPRIPEPAKQFMRQTFTVIESGDIRAIASAFTFGREDLLPAVFQRIVDEVNTQAGGQLSTFKYYLERHIGLDGDEHGPMAQRLVESLCGTDEESWKIATESAVACLKARIELWNGIDQLNHQRRQLAPSR